FELFAFGSELVFALVAAQADGLRLKVVNRLDVTHGALFGAHEDAVGHGAVVEETDTGQQRTVGDARCAEDDVFPVSKVVSGVDTIQIGVAGVLLQIGQFFAILWPHLHLHVAAKAFDGGGGNDALRRTANADIEIDPRLGHGGSDGGGDVAVDNHPERGASGADTFHQRLVANAR